jgi:hypothetical protein
VNERRKVHLNFEPPADAAVLPGAGAGAPRLVGRDRWLSVAEQLVGGWAPTLRAAFLIIVSFVGIVVLVGVMFGFGGVVVGVLASCLALYLAGRGGREVV